MVSSFLALESKIGNAPSERIPVSRQTLMRRAREFAPRSGTPLDQGFAARLPVMAPGCAGACPSARWAMGRGLKDLGDPGSLSEWVAGWERPKDPQPARVAISSTDQPQNPGRPPPPSSSQAPGPRPACLAKPSSAPTHPRPVRPNRALTRTNATALHAGNAILPTNNHFPAGTVGIVPAQTAIRSALNGFLGQLRSCIRAPRGRVYAEEHVFDSTATWPIS
jgi:hypothetical protein